MLLSTKLFSQLADILFFAENKQVLILCKLPLARNDGVNRAPVFGCKHAEVIFNSEIQLLDGLELTRDNLHATSKKYMTANGQTFFPEMIVKKIKESDSPNFLVSGIRPPSDIEVFKKAFGDKFVLVDVVISDDEVRYQRMLARGSERDGKSVEKLRENDIHEEEIFHTSESEKMADYIMKNDGTVDDFYAGVKDFYENYLKAKLD